jgi:hypothetical protein
MENSEATTNYYLALCSNCTRGSEEAGPKKRGEEFSRARLCWNRTVQFVSASEEDGNEKPKWHDSTVRKQAIII